MQTGAALKKQVKEGIEAGVYYYLTKPYNEDILLAIVAAAVEDALLTNSVQKELQELKTSIQSLQAGLINLQSSVFEYKTLEEVKNIAFMVANSCPDPKKVIIGISEIMINAVEHGNLGISFEEKSNHLLKGTLKNEIEHRLGLPEYQAKKATLTLDRIEDHISITITDEGNGFNWKEYLQLSPERAMHPNGRGIAMANMVPLWNENARLSTRLDHFGRAHGSADCAV